MYIKDVLRKAVANDIAAAVEPYVFIWRSFGAKLANDRRPTPCPWPFVPVPTCASNLRNTFRSRHSFAAQYLYYGPRTRQSALSKTAVHLPSGYGEVSHRPADQGVIPSSQCSGA